MARPVYDPPLAQAVRLEVEAPPPPGVVLNLLENHSGILGSYEWEAPSANTRIVSYYGSGSVPSELEFGITSSAGSGAGYFRTEPMRVTPGQYVGASFIPTYVYDRIRVWVEYLNASNAYLSASAVSGLYATSTSRAYFNVAAAVPANAAFARLVFEMRTAANGVYVPTGVQNVRLKEVMWATAPTQAAVNNVAFSSTFANWVNIMGSLHDITLERRELDVGTLDATILDATLDPAVAATIRPGRRMRCSATALAAVPPDVTPTVGGLVYEPLFTGRVHAAKVTYDLKRTDAKRARIVLSAVDGNARLAGTVRPNTPAGVENLAHALEGAGVPWMISGSSGTFYSAPVARAYNEQATALDQVAFLRDTARGFAWLDRKGVLNYYSSGVVSDRPSVGSLTAADYSDAEAGFDTEACINTVLVTVVSGYNGSDPNTQTEVTSGPYIDAASIRDWGPRPATFTVLSTSASPINPATYAAAVLAANAQPQATINSLRVPVLNNGQIGPSKTHLDLYNKVRVTNADNGIDRDMYVIGLRHSITPTAWLIDVDLAPVGPVARPLAQPTRT